LRFFRQLPSSDEILLNPETASLPTETSAQVDAGLSLPEGVLVDHRFRGMSAEQIYNGSSPLARGGEQHIEGQHRHSDEEVQQDPWRNRHGQSRGQIQAAVSNTTHPTGST
jgi:hypothetical protein